MKIFLICSKHCYPHVAGIKEVLEKEGHEVTLPNAYDDPGSEERHKEAGEAAHAEWKARMLRQSSEVIQGVDAVLVLNMEKHGIQNYIGGATFLEMYDAFRLGKKIYLHNPIPDGVLADEICGFEPVVLHGDLTKIS